jgi:hypothetical protein
MVAGMVGAARAQDHNTLMGMSLAVADGPKIIEAKVAEPVAPRAPAARTAVSPMDASVKDLDTRVTLDGPRVTYDLATQLERALLPYLNDPTLIPNRWVRDDVEMLRAAVSRPGDGFLDLMGNLFDVNDEDVRPWSTTTVVHLLAGKQVTGAVVPFASFAREESALQDEDRMGAGGGLAYYVAPSASIATEALYFGQRGNESSAFDKEARFSIHFQIQF